MSCGEYSLHGCPNIVENWRHTIRFREQTVFLPIFCLIPILPWESSQTPFDSENGPCFFVCTQSCLGNQFRHHSILRTDCACSNLLLVPNPILPWKSSKFLNQVALFENLGQHLTASMKGLSVCLPNPYLSIMYHLSSIDS